MVAAYTLPPDHPILQFTADEWRQMAARASLKSFASWMFADYQVAAHIVRLVSALEWAASTPDARLIVTMPPRHSKSLHVSEYFPAWFLGRHPDKRLIAASHTAQLAYTFSRRVRNKMADPRWPFPGVIVADDKGAVQAWDIQDHRGGYVAVGVGGSPTGHGGDGIIIDDPIRSAADAESETVRDALWEWYQGTMRTRLEPGGFIVVTATRWHEDDLTGRLLAAQETGGEQWCHLHLPAIDDDGNALWPERWPVSALERIRAAIGLRAWGAQFQGRPAPSAGSTLKTKWWRFWQPANADLGPVRIKIDDGTYIDAPVVDRPDRFDKHVQSWDMAFKDTKSGSFVVGQVWATEQARKFLLDQTRAHLDFPASVQAVRDLSARWPETREKWVEDKANGPAVVATLKQNIPGLIEVSPEGGKEARANAVTWTIEAGDVFLPHPVLAPWVWDFLAECSAFPNGKNDDQVDAMSQALVRLTRGVGTFEAIDGEAARMLAEVGW